MCDPYRDDAPPANATAREWTEAQAEAARVNVLATAGCGRHGCDYCPQPDDPAGIKLARVVAVALSDPRLPACDAMRVYGRRACAVAEVLAVVLDHALEPEPRHPYDRRPGPLTSHLEAMRALFDHVAAQPPGLHNAQPREAFRHHLAAIAAYTNHQEPRP